MSSFSGSLEIEDKVYEVIHFNYAVHRDIDFQGRAASGLKNSIIEVEIVIPPDDTTFIKWLCNNEVKSGNIKFDEIDQASTFNKVSFQGAICFSYEQDFHSNTAQPMRIIFKVSASTLTFTSGSTEFENQFFVQDS
jgi:Hemolysin coregulated protein Hcp (TssD)